ncbi:hypothetical protein BXU08_07795 [Sphingomonas sp. LM7]|nr:hypothetical protein BXU08_07795 [Sphingomonas sp. LM7]
MRLFEELEPLDSNRRETRLADTPPEVAIQVRALLEGAARRGVLDGPTPEFEAATAPAPGSSFVPGARVGPFEIIASIGMGGMGEVYLAERQDAGFTQRVAIKLLRIDSMLSAEIFARERRLLAQVDHPNIARLIDGGITPEGRPWMAMDYIDGEPLDRWCEANTPTLETRLRIFAQICEAVSHAHANLIVHRDLKPSNVMIDASGRAHLLDFGVAKLLADGGDALAQTQALITPDYAAPEQFDSGPVTTATDVHALGALLFELLTGRRPWQSGGSLPTIVRRVVTEEPPLPSKVAATLAHAPVPPVRLKGDLDAIVLKAMRKEPLQRYATVEALSEDIERAQSFRPVQARQGSRRYAFGRFVRRNRVPIAAVAAVIVAVLLGAVAFAIQAQRTGVERDLARAEARRSDSIVQTLTLMLGTTPSSADLTLKQALDQSAARMLARLDGSERSGQTIAAMGDLFVNIQDPKGAFVLYRGALDRGIGRDSSIWTARLRAGLADTGISVGQGEIAPKLLDEADQVFRTDPQRYAVDLQQTLLSRAAIARRKGDYDTAIGILMADLPGAERALAANDSALLTRYNNMLVYLIESNRGDEIPPLLERIDRTLAHPGARDVIQAFNIDQLRATWQLRQGNPAAAEQTVTAAAERRRRLFGESAGLATDLMQLGKARIAKRDFVGAETALGESETLAVRFLGPVALPTIVIKLALAQTRAERGDVAAATATLAEAAKAMAPLPTPNPLTGQYAMTQAVVALKAGNKPQAQAAAARARSAFAAMGPAGSFGLTSIATIERRIAALP